MKEHSETVTGAADGEKRQQAPAGRLCEGSSHCSYYLCPYLSTVRLGSVLVFMKTERKARR